LATTETLLVSLRDAWSQVSSQSSSSFETPEMVTASAFPWGVVGESALPSRSWSA